MDFEQITNMIKLMKETRIENAANLNIDGLLNKLNNYNDDEVIFFSTGKFLDGYFDSYRGYYDDLALGFDNEDKGFNTVGKLKNILNTALNEKVMVGYKGGEFSINQSTLVWLGNYGTTFEAEMIIDVQKVNGLVFVITKEDDI